MNLPSLLSPDDSPALAERGRALAPRHFDAGGFQQALDARAAAAGREEHAANRHGDRTTSADDERDEATSVAGPELNAPLTIHSFNEMLLVGGRTRSEAARAELIRPDPHAGIAQRVTREPAESRPTGTIGEAARAFPGGSAGGEAASQAGPIASDPRGAARTDEAGSARDDTQTSAPQTRRDPATESPAVHSLSPPAAGAAVAAVPQASARGDSAPLRPINAAAGAVQGAIGVPSGRRSSADAHLPRWMMQRGAHPSGQSRNSETSGRAQAIAAQVSRGLAAAMSRGAGEVTLRLNPESLGFLRVKLEVRPEGVAAKFEASTDAARGLLERNSETLRAALEARGWESAKVHVALLEERDAHPSAAELLRRLAREGEAVAQHAAAEPDSAWTGTSGDDPHDPRSGKDGSTAPRPRNEGPVPEGVGGSDGDGVLWLAPGAVDVVV